MPADETLDIRPVARYLASDDDPTTGIIAFEGEFRDPEALRGIETFSHIWLLWAPAEGSIDARAVELIGVEKTKGRGHVLKVRGVPFAHKTYIYDVKPYLPYADIH